MKKHPLWLALSFAFLVPTTGTASDSQINNSQLDRFQFSSSTTDEALSTLSDEEKALAKQWMLSENDWVKYKQVMAGPRGIWSPGLDPLTALGVSETDPRERRRYAEIWIKMEMRRAELELAFEVERTAAGKRIISQPVVNNQKWIDDWNRKKMEHTHEVMLFVSPNCVEECKPLYQEVYSSLGGGKRARLNIYFPKGTGAEDIGKWAREIGIGTEIVRSRTVTLNFDKGEYAKHDILQSELPEVRVHNLNTGEITKTFTDW